MNIQELAEKIDQCMHWDRISYRYRLKKLKNKPNSARFEKLSREVEYSANLRRQRQARLPKPDYPSQLPVSAKKQQIMDLINRHQVVIVAGETGSGKSTQLPKFCLELGRGVSAYIGHTQPRRLAARSIAVRISEELNRPLGDAVGYKVRFAEQMGENSHIKLMTDGILLAEISHDRLLKHYDTIIIDEAHERGLNIDFLLGYLKSILPKRPDLKLIITSATIDVEKFAGFFQAPVIQVSGRSYPVELQYVDDADEEDDLHVHERIVRIVQQLQRQTREGDVLIFFSGEREIHECMDLLGKKLHEAWEILPLYARLGMNRQNSIFHPGPKRRLILATNIAETSLTVPRIRYVIDTGTARISRYSPSSKLQRLPVEKISMASANQRAGRCGRIAPGVCFRLYSEADFAARREYTEAEILRSNLAGVILRMKSLKLGELSAFPMVDPPQDKAIRAGFNQLRELRAIDENNTITADGICMAAMPIDPQIARMILTATRLHALAEVLIIGSALAVQDVRERPLDAQQKADELHGRFTDKQSDFITLLNLWNHLEAQQAQLSARRFNRYCQEHFLSARRWREWRDVHKQLLQSVRELKLTMNRHSGGFEEIHQALISGLLGNVARKSDKHLYVGARGRQLRIFPGSGLFKSAPAWVVAAEVVETARVYARTVAAINPQWVVTLAPHLVKTSYFEPHWNRKRGEVAAYRQVSLYGLILISRKKVNFGPIDPGQARAVFIQQGLVEFGMDHGFLQRNRDAIARIRRLEAKTRRTDILVGDERMFEFYDSLIPSHVYDGRGFAQWYDALPPREQDRLSFQEQDLVVDPEHLPSSRSYPDTFALPGAMGLALSYRFEPGHEEDGVTVTIPVHLASQLREHQFQCLVPGLLREKMQHLLRALPKAKRKKFVPVPQTVNSWLQAATWPLEDFNAWFLSLVQRLEPSVNEAEVLNIPLPGHLVMKYQLIDEKGEILLQCRDFCLLQKRAGSASVNRRQTLVWELERDDVFAQPWNLPDTVTQRFHQMDYCGYPALCLQEHGPDKRIAIRVFLSRRQADECHHLACVYYLHLLGGKAFIIDSAQKSQMGRIRAQSAKIQHAPNLQNAVDRLVIESLIKPAQIRNHEQMEQAWVQVRDQYQGRFQSILRVLTGVVESVQRVHRALAHATPSNLSALADLQDQLHKLLPAHYLMLLGYEELLEYPRFFEAMEKRLRKMDEQPARDKPLMTRLKRHWDRFWSRVGAENGLGLSGPWRDYRWLLEEYRISLFAQEIGAKSAVSEKILDAAWEKLMSSR